MLTMTPRVALREFVCSCVTYSSFCSNVTVMVAYVVWLFTLQEYLALPSNLSSVSMWRTLYDYGCFGLTPAVLDQCRRADWTKTVCSNDSGLHIANCTAGAARAYCFASPGSSPFFCVSLKAYKRYTSPSSNPACSIT